MFKQRHGGHHGCGDRNHRGFEEIFAARGFGGFGRGPGGGRGPGAPGGPGGRGGRGFGDDGEGRVGRFLMQGDLRLVVLALIEKEPRHGYEIIKHIEDMTYGFYAPSPGVIYPTLTYLEEAGYIASEADGNKKRYAITEEGRAYLEQNRSFAATVLERISQFAERVREKQERAQRPDRQGSDAGPHLPRSVDAAMLNLREVIARTIEQDETRSGDLVRQLLDFADRLTAKRSPSGDNTQN